MEYILVSNIMNHFDTNNLRNLFHHGFCFKHSCETQLIGFTQEMFDSLEAADLIVMDLWQSWQ